MGTPVLTDSQVAAMRAVQGQTLDQSVTVTRRVAGAPDGAGGIAETTSTSTLSCRIAPAPANQVNQVQMLGGRVAELQVWRVTFAALADVRRNDRIVVAGKNLEVMAVLGEESRETARVCLAVERV